MKVLKILAISVAVLVVIFFTIGVLNPTFEYGNSVAINAPADKIWSVYINQKEAWIKGFQSQKLLSGVALSKNAAYETTIVSGEEMVMYETIMAIVPGKKIEWTLENDVLISQYSYEFIGDSSRSEVNTRYSVEGKNVLMKSLLFLSKGYLKNSDADMLTSLKKIAETEI